MPVPRITLAVGPSLGDEPTQVVTAFTSGTIKATLTGPQIGFTIPAGSPAAKTISGLATDVWVYRNGLLKWRCRVLPLAQEWTEDADSPCTITAVGYRRVVEARNIVDGPPVFNNVDQGSILFQLVQHTQSQNGGNLGITAGTYLTGQLRDRTEYKIGQNLGQIMSQMGDVINGCWWGIDAQKVFTALDWDDFPARADPIVWGMNARNLKRSPGVPFANASGAQGSTEQTVPVWVEDVDIAVDERGRWEVFDASHGSVTDQIVVAEYAAGNLEDHIRPGNQWDITLDPRAYFERGSDYEEGQYVNIVVPISAVDPLGPPAINSTAQVTEVSISFDDSGLTEVKLAAIETSSTSTGPPPTPPPQNTSLPVVNVTGPAGSVWSATPGVWTGATSFSYLWQQSTTATGPWVPAAPSEAGGNVVTALYAPPVADAGTFYRVLVTATGPGGSAVAASDSHSSAGTAAPANTAAPVMTSAGGTFTAGTQWSTTNGTWTGASTFAYQWQQATAAGGPWSNAAASGAGGSATGAVYVPPTAGAGLFYRALVTATGAGGSAAAPSNNHVSNSASVAAPVNTVLPHLTKNGSTTPATWEAGEPWVTTPGTWTNASSFAYVWQQSTTATGPWVTAAASAAGGNVNTDTYAPPVAGAGLFYRASVIATGPGGVATAFSDAKRSVVTPVSTTDIRPPAGKVLFGASTQARGAESGDRWGPNGIDKWVAFAGVRPDTFHDYQDLGSFDGTISAAHKAILLGSGPSDRMVYWVNMKLGVSWAALAGGAQDADLRTLANNLATYPYKVVLAPHHEPDNDIGGAGSGMTANDYADMFRRFVTVMRSTASGAVNVEFCINYLGYLSAAGVNGQTFNAMWPGDDVVDWVSWDPYWQNMNKPDFASKINTLVAAPSGMTSFYQWAKTPKTVGVNGLRYPFAGRKKMSLTEWGTWFATDPVEGADTSAKPGTLTDAQAAQILDTFDDQVLSFPEIVHLQHYNNNAAHKNDIDGHPLASAAFNRIANAPVFTVNMAAIP